MKITVKQRENGDYGLSETMLINGEEVLTVAPLCECPEDAIIERDLVSCSEVARFMKRAWAAGRRGEDFSISTIFDTEEEEI